MENPLSATFSNNTLFSTTEMDQFIPKELQLPVAVAIVVVIVILGGLKFSSMQGGKGVQFASSNSFKSPDKNASVSKSGTPINQKTGTVMTPAGRRSARLARRKED